MGILNRVVATLTWITILLIVVIAVAAPFWAIQFLQEILVTTQGELEQLQSENPANFIIGQATIGITAVVVFGVLIWFTAMSGYNRGVKIRTVDGRSADTKSISRRLEWHLEQVAEVNNVVPEVKARGGAVDIRLEVEVTPEVDIPMKTDEVVILTRDVIEDTIGLKLGKLDVHLRCAPFEPSFIG